MHGGDIYRNQVALDFSVNGNPLGMPAEVERALREAVALCDRYPDPRAEELCRSLGEYLGVSPDLICPAAGASELLLAVVRALHPRRVLLQAPSFSGYERACRSLEDCRPEWFATTQTEHFAVGEECVEQLPEGVDMLFVANPNNPTGVCIAEPVLRRLAERTLQKGITLVIDECFLEFTENGADASFVAELDTYPHVIVLRAFTKICAIPGVRLGYSVCGNANTNRRIREQLPEWNVSVPAQQAGKAAAQVLAQGDYLRAVRGLLTEQRAYLAEGLRRLDMRVVDSEANFLLFYSAMRLYEPLLDRGILIRDCSDFAGLGEGYYRVAVRGAAENRRLLEALEEVTAQTVQADGRHSRGY